MIAIENSRPNWEYIAELLEKAPYETCGDVAATHIREGIAEYDRQQQRSRKAAVLAEAVRVHRGLTTLMVDATDVIDHLHDLGWDLTEIEKG
jgi:hypothetical protein